MLIGLREHVCMLRGHDDHLICDGSRAGPARQVEEPIAFGPMQALIPVAEHVASKSCSAASSLEVDRATGNV